MTEAQQRVSTLEYRRKELACSTGNVPVLGKQQRQPGVILSGRTPPVDANRYEQELLAARLDTGFDEAQQSCRTLLLATKDEAAHSSQHDDAASFADAAKFQGFHW